MKRLAALLCLAACAQQPNLPQTVYAAEGAYTAAAMAEATYIHQPGSNYIVIAQLRALDARAYAQLVPLRVAAAQNTATQTDVDRFVDSVKALSDYETAHGIK